MAVTCKEVELRNEEFGALEKASEAVKAFIKDNGSIISGGACLEYPWNPPGLRKGGGSGSARATRRKTGIWRPEGAGAV